MSLLEVIAVSVADVVAAETGGADRAEIVADLQSGGLSPDPRLVERMRRETEIPLRVMLRAKAGFRTTRPELERLRGAAKEHAEAGADGFVFGFLDSTGAVDLTATEILADAVAPLPWTFHRAIDHAASPEDEWRGLGDLPGLDAVLSGGSARGVETGIAVLLRRASTYAAPLMLVGGGLRRKHVAVLAAAGVDAFHVGAAVRSHGSPGPAVVDAALVRQWRTLVDASPYGWDPAGRD